MQNISRMLARTIGTFVVIFCLWQSGCSSKFPCPTSSIKETPSAAQEAPAVNLVTNGNFIAGLEGWIPQEPSVAPQIDTRVFHGEKGQSLKLTVLPQSDKQGYMQSKRITRDPAIKKYRFAGWLKAENVNQPLSTRFSLFCWDKNGKWLRHFPLPSPAFTGGQTDWQSFEQVCEPGEDVASFSVTLRLDAGKEKIPYAATAWFDDITLTAVTSTAAEDAAKKAEEKAGLWIFPAAYQNDVYHLIENFSCGFEVSLYGDPKAMKDALLVVDLPPGFDFLGAAPRESNKKDSTNQQHYCALEPVAQTGIRRDGKKYARYTITLDGRIRSQIKPVKIKSGEEISWGNYERLFVKAQKGMAGKNGKFYLKAVWSNSTESTREYVVEAKVLPAVQPPLKKAERFELYRSYFFMLNVPELENVAASYIDFWKSLQQKPWTQILWRLGTCPEKVRARYTDNFRMAYMFGNYQFVTGYEKRTAPVKKADGTTANANMDRKNICPTSFLEGPDASLLEEMFTNMIVKATAGVTNVETVVWDFEPNVDYDYCDTCRQKFAQIARLQAVPDIKEVREKQAEKWFDFRTKQHNALIERIAAIMKKDFPKLQFWICTDQLHTGNEILSRWCGVDERLADPVVDVHLCMPYYSGLRFFNDVELNVKILKKPVFPLNDAGGERLISFYSQYTPQKLKQNIVAAAMLGCKGFGFWPDEIMDGLYMTKVRDAYQIVGMGESYYFAQRDDALAMITPVNVTEKSVQDEKGNIIRLISPQFDKTLKWALHKKDNNFLVTLLDYDTRPIVVSIKLPSLPDGDYRVIDAESQKVYVNGKGKPLAAADIRQGFLASVDKDDAVALEITTNAPLADAGTISQSALEKELKAKPVQQDALADKKEGNASIGEVALKTGTLGLKMEAAGNRIIIDQDKRASVISWQIKDSANANLLAHREPGALDEFVFFNEPAQLRYEFKLKQTDIKNGIPKAVFVCKPERVGADASSYPVENFTVEKEITLERAGTLIRTRYCVVHNSASTRETTLGFRIRHLPTLAGSLLATNQALTDLVQIRLQTPAGEESWVSKDNSNTILMAPGCKRVDFANGSDQFKSKEWVVSPIIVQSPQKGSLKIIPDLKQTAGVFIWWSKNLFTIEPLSVERALKPGETFEYQSVVEYNP